MRYDFQKIALSLSENDLTDYKYLIKIIKYS